MVHIFWPTKTVHLSVFLKGNEKIPSVQSPPTKLTGNLSVTFLVLSSLKQLLFPQISPIRFLCLFNYIKPIQCLRSMNLKSTGTRLYNIFHGLCTQGNGIIPRVSRFTQRAIVKMFQHSRNQIPKCFWNLVAGLRACFEKWHILRIGEFKRHVPGDRARRRHVALVPEQYLDSMAATVFTKFTEPVVDVRKSISFCYIVNQHSAMSSAVERWRQRAKLFVSS